jgi:SprT-like family.
MLSSDNAMLETAFDILNRVYFNSELPKAVITIQSTPRSYGHFTTYKIWKDKKDSYHEIIIAAEYLTRPIEDVLATLTHEMVHLYAIIKGISDTSSNGRYHNKNFKKLAEERDLIIEYVKYVGYSKTSPSKRFIEVLKENGLCAGIDRCRTERFMVSLPTVTGGGDNTGKKKSSTRKYVCEECGISVRATKDVNIICGDCMNVMVKVD